MPTKDTSLPEGWEVVEESSSSAGLPEGWEVVGEEESRPEPTKRATNVPGVVAVGQKALQVSRPVISSSAKYVAQHPGVVTVPAGYAVGAMVSPKGIDAIDLIGGYLGLRSENPIRVGVSRAASAVADAFKTYGMDLRELPMDDLKRILRLDEPPSGTFKTILGSTRSGDLPLMQDNERTAHELLKRIGKLPGRSAGRRAMEVLASPKTNIASTVATMPFTEAGDVPFVRKGEEAAGPRIEREYRESLGVPGAMNSIPAIPVDLDHPALNDPKLSDLERQLILRFMQQNRRR